MRISVDEPAVRPEPQGVHAPRSLLQAVWQRRWLVLLGLAVGLAVGSLVHARRQRVYRSSAQVLVVKKRSDVVPVTGGDPMQPYQEDFVSAHIALLKSPKIVQKAVEKRNLARLRTFEGQGNPTSAVIASLSVTSNNRTIIELSYRGPHPEETAEILDALIESYKDFLVDAYHTVSQDTANLIIKASELLTKDLVKKEEEYRKFREGGPVPFKSKDGNSLQYTRVAEIEAKQSAHLIRKAELEGRLKAIEAAKKKGEVDASLLPPLSESKGKARGIEEQLLPLILEEEELLQDYGEDHPRVRSVRAKLARTRQQLERSNAGLGSAAHAPGPGGKGESAVDRYVRSVQHELAQIEVSQEALARLLAPELERARALGNHEMKEEALRNALLRTQQLYEQTIKRLEEVNLVRDFGGYDAQVIAPPGEGVRVSPKLVPTMLMAVLLGLLGGAGLAYLAEVTDKSFRSPEEVRRRLRLPLMGHIPYARRPEKARSGSGQGEEVRGADLTLCAHHRPSSREAESYRSLRTALFFKTQGQAHAVIQITSPNMGDGKTTVTANLAAVIAQSGKRVVVVDADFRRPKLHRLFGLPSVQAGLRSVLAGDVPLAAAVQESCVPGVAVLPCGTQPPNPAELLTSRAFEATLTALKSEYDYVLVDTPPLLAVTDPCVVAGHVDGVLFTIRVSKNGRPAAERAKELLTNLGVNVMGVVINGIGREAGANGYGYYHYDDDRYEYRGGDGETQRTEKNGQAVTP
jgi:capsular exopolysaccharide synthesis family protein